MLRFGNIWQVLPNWKTFLFVLCRSWLCSQLHTSHSDGWEVLQWEESSGLWHRPVRYLHLRLLVAFFSRHLYFTLRSHLLYSIILFHFSLLSSSSVSPLFDSSCCFIPSNPFSPHLQAAASGPSSWLLSSSCSLSNTPGEELCSSWEDLFPTCVLLELWWSRWSQEMKGKSSDPRKRKVF